MSKPATRTLSVTVATSKKSAKSGLNEIREDSPSQLIDGRIKELSDWRGETLARVRTLIKQADPDVVEEWKWRGVPVWEHDGIICTGETYRNVMKMTFAKGASLEDPSGLFNSSLEGNTRRAIDLHEGDEIDEKAFKALIRAAVALNISVRINARPVRSQKRPKSARDASQQGSNNDQYCNRTRSVVVEREIAYPPEKIWRALTQPHLIEEWLMKNDFEPVVGHRFNLRGDWGGVLDCEVLAIEPKRTLSYTWNFAQDDAAYTLRSVVTFTLAPTSKGTHLRMEQTGFRPDQKQALGGAKAGWQQFFAKLEQVLARKD